MRFKTVVGKAALCDQQFCVVEDESLRVHFVTLTSQWSLDRAGGKQEKQAQSGKANPDGHPPDDLAQGKGAGADFSQFQWRMQSILTSASLSYSGSNSLRLAWYPVTSNPEACT
eukprot:1159526-Pelagomonas_calceolata.AAC.7